MVGEWERGCGHRICGPAVSGPLQRAVVPRGQPGACRACPRHSRRPQLGAPTPRLLAEEAATLPAECALVRSVQACFSKPPLVGLGCIPRSYIVHAVTFPAVFRPVTPKPREAGDCHQHPIPRVTRCVQLGAAAWGQILGVRRGTRGSASDPSPGVWSPHRGAGLTENKLLWSREAAQTRGVSGVGRYLVKKRLRAAPSNSAL